MKPRFLFATALMLALVAPFALAQNDEATRIETSKTFGDYEVLYNVFHSTDLSAEMAQRYQLVRGARLAIVNVSLRNRTNTESMTQPALISGGYSDLMQRKPLAFREIREHNAVYYIAQLPFTDHETLRFDISVQPIVQGPAPVGAPFKVSFTRKFYGGK